MSRTYGIKGPLSYVLQEDEAVPSEVNDPIQGNDYFDSSGTTTLVPVEVSRLSLLLIFPMEIRSTAPITRLCTWPLRKHVVERLLHLLFQASVLPRMGGERILP